MNETARAVLIGVVPALVASNFGYVAARLLAVILAA